MELSLGDPRERSLRVLGPGGGGGGGTCSWPCGGLGAVPAPGHAAALEAVPAHLAESPAGAAAAVAAAAVAAAVQVVIRGGRDGRRI